MKLEWWCILTIAMSVASGVNAQTTLPDIVQRQCLACHQIDKKRVGPSFYAIAQRYKESDAHTYLAEAIRAGSRGKWGAVPMPAQSQVSRQQAEEIAEWLLALNKKNN